MQTKSIVSLVVMALLLSSCAKKKESATVLKKQLPISFEQLSVDDIRTMTTSDLGMNDKVGGDNSDDYREILSMHEYEARYADIPTPFSVTPHANGCCENESAMVFRYTTNLDHDELVAFYEIEMEQLGWRKRFQSDDPELLILFEKPNRLAVVSVRPRVGARRSSMQSNDLTLTIEKV